MVSNLPRELVEEVLSRVPVTSLRRIRSTCKKWNALSKNWSFAKKHLQEKKFMIVLFNFRVYLTSVNHNHISCMKREGSLISLDNSCQIDISQVFHCDGLVLCISKDYTKLVVWNPYLGQTRWIQPTYKYPSLHCYSYALGYEKRSKPCYKILRFIGSTLDFKIYDFNSDSWRVLDITPDWQIEYYDRGLSLKGNTYWFAKEKPDPQDGNFLICFDFTRERFGLRLPLPPSIEWIPEDTLTLSSVRDEQLAVLFQRCDTFQMEIWVTAKIEPNTVSWNIKVFLETSFHFRIEVTQASFFIDEEKKVVVVFDKGVNLLSNIAYILGVDGSLKKVAIGESPHTRHALVCSYVPSLAQLC